MNNLLGVIVDAGHGGSDPGAVSGNLKEKDLTLKAAQYMERRLKELGIDARLTRDSDISLPKDERIKKVKNLFNNNSNVILVSNHINAGGGEGAEIVYALRNNSTLANKALKNIEEAGQINRGAYQRVLPENPSKDYYYILRETGNVEPILVEYGFIDNEKDSKKLINNLEDYVEGVVKAIADYANIPYVKPNDINPDTYEVKRGDTLYSISRKFNIPISELFRLNNLQSDILSIGQILIIKESPLDEYIVKKGDTLYSIASRFNTTVDEIIKNNNLTTTTLSIGQKLRIKSIADIPSIPDIPIIPDTPSDEYDYYTVVKGDSLWAISQRYNISVKDLIEINNLSDTVLQIGDKLLVPKVEQKKYVVSKGDTLWSIAKKFNISVQELKNLNNLNSNLLSIGQELKIK